MAAQKTNFPLGVDVTGGDIAGATTTSITDSTDKRFCTDAQKTVIGNTSGTNSGNETTTTLGALINGATAKTTPVDADMTDLVDSQASNIIKKLTWANVKATLKAYFDTVYTLALLGGVPTTRTVNSKALSADITIGPDDMVNGTTNKVYTATEQTKLAGIATSANVGVVPNGAITPATFTKISYDAKGLVTAGAAANADDFADGTTNKAYTATEKTKLAGIATSANNYIHPNHTGDVTSVADGTQTIAAKAVTLAKMADMATASLIGRATAATGVPEVLSAASARTLLNVADGATANTKATGAEVNTGTDDAKFVTAKAVADSDIVRGGVVGQINGLTGKTTPVDADVAMIEDSAASWAKKKLTLANLKAFLKTYFDGVYDAAGSVTKISLGLNNVDNIQQMPLSYLDTDITLAGNSDVKVASQKAIKAYVAGLTGVTGAMVYKDVIDASTNPNYPAATSGWNYVISVAGKIGGASGIDVDVNDTIICKTTGIAGTQAAVGANWSIIQGNLVGAVTGPASAAANNLASFNSTTGKVIQDSGLSLDTTTTLGTSDVKIPSQNAVKTYVDGVRSLTMTNALETSFVQTGVGLSATVVDTFAKATFRSAKWLIQGYDVTNSKYEMTEILAVHDGSTVSYTEYGKVSVSTPGITYTVVVNGANIELKATGTSVSNTIKGVRVSINV